MGNEIVLQLDPSRGNSRNSEGSFVTLKNGRILFAYTRYGPSHADHGHAHIAARISDDGGHTWSSRDRVLVPRGDAQNVMSVSLLRLQDGRIAMLYLHKGLLPDGTHDCIPYLCFSEDEAKSFSPGQPLVPPGGYHIVNNDRLVQLASGRLVIPVALHRRRGEAMPSENLMPRQLMEAGALVYFYLSDDGGAHWYESASNCYISFADGGGLQEPGLVELQNGKLWGWSRARPNVSSGATGLGWTQSPDACQWVTSSRDGGRNWSAPKRTQFLSPASPMSLKRIPSTGDLLAVWNDRSGRYGPAKPQPISWNRTPLVTAISRDEGKTWTNHRPIEDAPDHGYCYCAIHFVEDAVLLAYCAGGASSQIVLDTLRVRRIALKALYA